MDVQRTIGLLDHLTFKGNHKGTRYGWLRLTPAYSVHLVSELLDEYLLEGGVVLDPFCGTGTTALVCAERGIRCDTTDINPFLLWLTKAKTRSYSATHLEAFKNSSEQIAGAIAGIEDQPRWAPALHQIEKWWDEGTLGALCRAWHHIDGMQGTVAEEVIDLLKIAFCGMMIEKAHVSFGHQSMSFKKRDSDPTLPFESLVVESVLESWERSVSLIAKAASSPVINRPRVFHCDARTLSDKLEADRYSCVITSPPYPNRISYIRELRPYMYWLGYLTDGRTAGNLDWQAIGGTWGCATSNLTRWEPVAGIEVPHADFEAILGRIEKRGVLLSQYVHKYFCDMVVHTRQLYQVVRSGGAINYIVGNSKFYDVMLPVEAIYGDLFQAAGFEAIDVRVIRKRTSKKELFEFLVSARKP